MASPTPIRILLVDDEEHIRKTVCRFLRMEGYEVRVAGNGEEALHELTQCDFHVVVLDLRMPGINGFEVLHRIKSVHPRTKVIMLTGVADAEPVRAEALAKGASSLLIKPCKLETLLTTITAALEAS